jgi:hypothetical protein
MKSKISVEYIFYIDNFYYYLYKRDFAKAAEMVSQLLNKVEQTLDQNDRDENCMLSLGAITFKFKEYYLDWVMRQSGSIEKEERDLDIDNFVDNFFSYSDSQRYNQNLITKFLKRVKHT